jgi:hypothetical protein
MDSDEATTTVEEVITLVSQHYFDTEVAAEISRALQTGLADGRYGLDEPSLAEAVTADLQSVNGDKHLRLVHHVEPLPEREPGDDTEELIAMARWADQTSGGIAKVERLRGNIGHLDIAPVLFPVAICGDAMTAAMNLVAPTDALIIDVRGCLGGDPAMVAWLCSYFCMTAIPCSFAASTSAISRRSPGRCHLCPAAGSVRPSRCMC